MVSKLVKVRSTSGLDEQMALVLNMESLKYLREQRRRMKNNDTVKRYYLRHPDKAKERISYNKQWKMEHKDRVRIHNHNWYVKHGKDWYWKNRDRILKRNHQRTKKLRLKVS